MGDIQHEAQSRRRQLAAIWCEVFNLPGLPEQADFLDLGGDSLSAVQIVARVDERFGEGLLAPDEVFRQRSFGKLLASLENALALLDTASCDAGLRDSLRRQISAMSDQEVSDLLVRHRRTI